MENIENKTGEVTNEVVSELAAEVQEQLPTALDEFMADTETESEADSPVEAEVETPQEHEDIAPKGIKGRIAAAETKADKLGYERGKKEAYAEWERQKADYEAKIAAYEQEKLETTIKAEAKELAKTEHISEALAERLVRAEKGVAMQGKATTPTHAEAPVNAPANDATMERAKALMAQNDAVLDRYGINALEVYKADADVQQKVNSGEWDFRDVALYAMSKNGTTKKVTPAPVRGGSNDSKGSLSFATMTDAQFDAFDKKISMGEVYRPPR